MSRNTIFKEFFKALTKVNIEANDSIDDAIIKMLYFSILCSGHLVYATTTKKNEEITVSNKYTMVRNGFTDFMVIDNHGRHFNVNNSIWFNKWDSIEDWNKINEKKSYNVKYYGWRMPLLGIFPNIVDTKFNS
jgi:hypothetical protein